jgi:hypothetical protein
MRPSRPKLTKTYSPDPGSVLMAVQTRCVSLLVGVRRTFASYHPYRSISSPPISIIIRRCLLVLLSARPNNQKVETATPTRCRQEPPTALAQATGLAEPHYLIFVYDAAALGWEGRAKQVGSFISRVISNLTPRYQAWPPRRSLAYDLPPLVGCIGSIPPSAA